MINKLKQHKYLKIFDISWNNIGNSLVENTHVYNLEKSNEQKNNNFNNLALNAVKKTMSLGFKINTNPTIERKPSEFAVELSEYFCLKSTSLIHLDISHNNICYEDAKLLSNFFLNITN